MKFPKNKATVYVVLRGKIPIAVFPVYEAANNYRDACTQELIDRGITEITFDVTVSTYYETEY